MRLAQDAREAPRLHLQPRRVLRVAGLSLGEVALREHGVDDGVAPRQRIGRGLLAPGLTVRVLVRVVERRALGQPGQEGGLRIRQLGEVGDAEVVRRRGPDPVRAVAVVDEVQVGLEDLLLALAARVCRGDLHREDVLANLVLEVARLGRLRWLADVGLLLGVVPLGGRFVRVRRLDAGFRADARIHLGGLALFLQDTGIVDDLLGDRRGALDDLAGLEVGKGRPDGRLDVHPVVLPVRAVLAGHRGLPDKVRKLIELHGLSVLALEPREEGLAGPVVDVRGLGRLEVVEDVRVGQSGRVIRVRREHPAGGAHDRPDEGQAEHAEGDEEECGQAPTLGAAAHGPARHHQVTAPALESRVHRAEG